MMLFGKSTSVKNRHPDRLGSKIRSIAELATIAEQARHGGRTVALCHGVFDLLHLGHVKHIEAAREMVDILMVTVTADAFVNKGPGRPVFPEQMRAEMLASLAKVDWVGVNYAATAEPVLDAIKPNFYVKGSDYENPVDDITGKISGERETVEKHGGEVVFTKDVTFSSSTLINRYLDIYDPPLRDLLDRIRDRNGLQRTLDLIESVRNFKVLIVGDAIIDEYCYVDTLGMASKENLIATQYKDREIFAGGVFAAANHVAGFCREVEVITALGADDGHEAFIRRHLKPNVSLVSEKLAGRPTTRKLRYVQSASIKKLFEVYFMNDAPIETAERQTLNSAVAARIADADLVIATDFGHGLIDCAMIDTMADKARFLAVNTQTNSANAGYNLITKYPRVDYICIDAPEARLAAADKFSDIPTIVAKTLPQRVAYGRAIITHGVNGCYAYEQDKPVVRVPAFTKTVVDTIGAGDAFLAVTSPLVAAGGDMGLIAFVGNAVGAMKVGIVGHRTSVEKVPLIKFITALLK